MVSHQKLKLGLGQNPKLSFTWKQIKALGFQKACPSSPSNAEGEQKVELNVSKNTLTLYANPHFECNSPQIMTCSTCSISDSP